MSLNWSSQLSVICGEQHVPLEARNTCESLSGFQFVLGTAWASWSRDACESLRGFYFVLGTTWASWSRDTCESLGDVKTRKSKALTRVSVLKGTHVAKNVRLLLSAPIYGAFYLKPFLVFLSRRKSTEHLVPSCVSQARTKSW